MSDPEALTRWAKTRATLTAARKEILRTDGLTEETFRELTEQAIAQIGNVDFVDTEFGRVNVRRKPIYEHHSPIKIGERTEIFLSQYKPTEAT